MDEALQKALNEFSTTILALVMTVLVPYGLNLLRTWVKAKIASIEDATLRQGIEYAFDRLDATAETVVAEISQTFVKRDQNNKVSNASESQARGIARLHDRLDPRARTTLEKLYGRDRLAQIYRGKIESKIKAIPRC